MDKNKRLALTGSLYLLIFAYAISSTIVGPLVQTYMAQYKISLAESGFIPGLQGFGGVLAVISGIFIMDKVRKSTMVITTFFAYSICVFAVSLFNAYALMLVSFFLIGASTKLLDTSINANIADINRHKRGLYVNLLHAFFGLGALIGPLFSGWLLKTGLTTHGIFLALGIFCIAFLAVNVVVTKNSPREPKPVNNENKGRTLALIKNKDILRLCIAAFLYTSFSISLSNWMPIYMQKEFNADIIFSGLPVTVLWAGIIIGRLLNSYYSNKANLLRLLFYSNALCTVLWIIAAAVNTPVVIIVLSGVCGVCIGGIVPVGISRVCDWFPNNTGTVSSYIFVFVTLGSMIIPWLTGFIMQGASYWLGIASLAVAPLGASVCFFKFAKAKE
jgi:fucose permease